MKFLGARKLIRWENKIWFIIKCISLLGAKISNLASKWVWINGSWQHINEHFISLLVLKLKYLGGINGKITEDKCTLYLKLFNSQEFTVDIPMNLLNIIIDRRNQKIFIFITLFLLFGLFNLRHFCCSILIYIDCAISWYKNACIKTLIIEM